MNNCCGGADPFFVYDVDNPPSTCDKKTLFGRCNRPAFQEVYWKTLCKDGMKVVSLRHWSYLCRYHYYLDRIKNWLFHRGNWYCEVDEKDDDNAIY